MQARAKVRVAATAVLLLVLTGCAKMDAALDKQWVTVSFSANTTVAQELHVRAACSHVPNVRPMALPSHRTLINSMSAVAYNTTNASDGNVAQLQECLSKFKFVQGITQQTAGDEGD
jgi:hypothetical protein